MQTAYNRSYRDTLYPGMLATGGMPRNARTYSASGAVAQVSTVTAAAGAATVTLGFTDDYGRSTTITGSADNTSPSTTAESLKDLIEADSIASAMVQVTRASGVLTLTALRQNAAFTLDDSDDANLTAATSTSASNAPAVPFGVVVVQRLVSGASQEGECALPDAANNTAKVVTISPTAQNNEQYNVNVLFPGRPDLNPVNVAMDSGGSASDADIVDTLRDKINAQASASSVVASNVGDDLVITAEIAGLDFLVSSSTTGSNAFSPSTTTANVGAKVVGLAARKLDIAQSDDTALPTYPAGANVLVSQGNDDFVALCDANASLSDGDAVYYRQTASGSEQKGAIRQDADSGDALLLSGWTAVGGHKDIVIGTTTYRVCAIRRTL